MRVLVIRRRPCLPRITSPEELQLVHRESPDQEEAGMAAHAMAGAPSGRYQILITHGMDEHRSLEALANVHHLREVSLTL